MNVPIPRVDVLCPNLTRVQIATLTVWYSYSEPIAFHDRRNKGPTVMTSYAPSRTTVKHMRIVDPKDQASCAASTDEFTSSLKQVLVETFGEHPPE